MRVVGSLAHSGKAGPYLVFTSTHFPMSRTPLVLVPASRGLGYNYFRVFACGSSTEHGDIENQKNMGHIQYAILHPVEIPIRYMDDKPFKGSFAIPIRCKTWSINPSSG